MRCTRAASRIAIETNGTLPVPRAIDWICVSPKAGTDLKQRSGDELKLVYPQAGPRPGDGGGATRSRHRLPAADGRPRRQGQHRPRPSPTARPTPTGACRCRPTSCSASLRRPDQAPLELHRSQNPLCRPPMRIYKEFQFEAAHFLPSAPAGSAERARARPLVPRPRRRSTASRAPTPATCSTSTSWPAPWPTRSDALDHRLLNEVDGLEAPTLERIAMWLWNRLQNRVPGLAEIEIARDSCREGCHLFGAARRRASPRSKAMGKQATPTVTILGQRDASCRRAPRRRCSSACPIRTPTRTTSRASRRPSSPRCAR